jgi:hypothetical protein
MRKKKKKETWPSEASMFTAFMEDASGHGFELYPESCGFDLILRAGPDIDYKQPNFHGLGPGDQIAIEGKLRPSLEVLHQAMPPDFARYGDIKPAAADYYAVLVPEAGPGFRKIAEACGIAVFVYPPIGKWRVSWASALTLDLRTGRSGLELPPSVVMEAGRPGPRRVTKWKVQAVELCLKALSRNGELRSTDFVGTVVSPRTFLLKNWIVAARKEGRNVVYKLVDDPSRPDLNYPEIVAAVRKVPV